MNTRTSSPRMTERRVREYYEELKSLFSKMDSDWTDKAKSVRSIAHKFYVEISRADKDCTYASAIGGFYGRNPEQYKKAAAFKDELNEIIHTEKRINRKEYLAIYNSFVQQISFATGVYPDRITMDYLCKHHKESAIEKESRFRECINGAIENKLKVMLYGYCASNSNSKANRTIEPIEFICDGRSIWAYEEKQDGTGALRQFRLCRTENVKVLEDDWAHEADHRKAYVDPFEWTRPTPATIHITILVGPSAKNHLVEMCPESRRYLTPNGKDQWILDADVHDLTPVKSFCQEYKSSITVYAPDELRRLLGLEVLSHEESQTMLAPKGADTSKNEGSSNSPEMGSISVCGFKGMLKKIMTAVREYEQERRLQRKDKSRVQPTEALSQFATDLAA